MSTDTADHPERDDPWHALGSFDSLGEHLSGLGYTGDDILLSAMIHAGVVVLRQHDLLIT